MTEIPSILNDSRMTETIEISSYNLQCSSYLLMKIDSDEKLRNGLEIALQEQANKHIKLLKDNPVIIAWDNPKVMRLYKKILKQMGEMNDN